MSRPTPPAYKTRNWPSYNEALKRRGSLTIWFDPAMTWEAAPTGKRGRQPDYSDAAIQTCLTMKVLFGMALRQTTGFVESLLCLIGLDWAVPDFSTLSRRQGEMGPWPQCGRVSPSNAEGEHSLPRLGRPAAPAGRQHRDQGRGRRGMERPQARRQQTPLAPVSRTGGETVARLAQDPHRHRRDGGGSGNGPVDRFPDDGWKSAPPSSPPATWATSSR